MNELLKGFTPEIGIIAGSGLGFLSDLVIDPITLTGADLPEYPVSTAPGHDGRLVFGTLAGKRVCVVRGRVHYYEGYDFEKIAYSTFLLGELGARAMILTNASGAVNPDYKPGDIMLISDHIKLCAESPLRGEVKTGDRFPDMSEVYTKHARLAAHRAAHSMGLNLREGVYMFFGGPQYETPAEIRAAAKLGADAVGMSTVPEAIAARACGMDVLGLSLCCNMAAGIFNEALSGDAVLAAAEAAKPYFSKLVLKILEMI